ncbi:ATP-binding cassette sub-family A member 2 (ATP-binding cassette transporter 2) (ATP-binding cassette 2), partial [Durusdinium trenchii]
MAVRTFEQTDVPPAWRTDEQGFTASGPVGLGTVSIVGFDPDAHANNDRIAAAETAWHAIMAPLITDRLEEGRRMLGASRWDGTSLGTVSMQAALGWVSRAPVVGMGAFLAIFAMMLGLAIALGPIDRFALRRLRSLHRWWLTAIAWIALATVGAWLAPSYVRSGPTTVGNIRTVDAWQDTTGTVHSWQTTISGIFLNRSAAIEFDSLDQTAWLSPAVHPWQYTGMGSLTSVSTNAAPATQPTTARLWTTRSFEQQGPTTLPLGVDFAEGRDRFELRLRGPIAERVETIAVRTGGRWLHLLPGGSPRRDGSDLILHAIRRDLVAQPPRSFDIDHLLGSRDGLRPFMYGDVDRRPPPSLTLELRGPANRTKSFEALSDTDDWAVVYLAWDGDDPLIAANARNLTKRYGKLLALDDLSLDIGPGEVFGFIGPNGAGKSTTMKILACLMKADSGKATVDGHDVRTEGATIRRLIGYMPDFLGVYEDLTVDEYLQFFASAFEIPRKERKTVVEGVLELTDLADKRRSPVDGLSRGMTQRLG